PRPAKPLVSALRWSAKAPRAARCASPGAREFKSMSDAEKPEGEAKKPKADGAPKGEPKGEKKAGAKAAAPKGDAPKKLKENKGDYVPRLKQRYKKEIRARLKEQFKYTNEMQIPAIDKVVINMGVGEAVADSKKLKSAMDALTAISGQKPMQTKSR